MDSSDPLQSDPLQDGGAIALGQGAAAACDAGWTSPSSAFRARVARFYQRRLVQGGRRLDERELAASAIVFAPHQDDECLGCGGTIIKKIEAGAEVVVAFATDGAASHAGLIAPERLRRQRAEEARVAAARLGVRADRVVFLDHPDGGLAHALDRLRADVGALLARRRPEQIFVPHVDEPPADHRATRTAVLAALASWAAPVQVLEYPVWWWFHWPWVRLSLERSDLARARWRRTLETRFGWRTAGTFDRWVDLGAVLERKRWALEAHISQTTRRRGRADWPILADVARGDFLARLLTEREVFRAYPMRQGRTIDG